MARASPTSRARPRSGSRRCRSGCAASSSRTTISGYEIFFRCLTGEKGYAEIVRWNGAVGDWTSLQRREGPEYGVKDGDVIEATIEGNVIKGFINGEEKITVTDDTWASGAPGVGFNFGVGDTYADHGFSSFEVDTWE